MALGEVFRALRSSIAGRRPTGRAGGEVFINFADRVMGWIAPDGSAVDLPYLHKEKGGDVIGNMRVQGIFRVMPASVNSNSAVLLSNGDGQSMGGFEAARDSGTVFLGKRRTSDAAWQARIQFLENDVTLANVKSAPDGNSVLDRNRADTFFLRKAAPSGQTTTHSGPFRVTGAFTVDAGVTFNGHLGVALDITARHMRASGNVAVAGNLVVEGPAGGTAQIRLTNRNGNIRRGLVYAAEDGSYVRLLKHTGSDAATDVYLNLVSGDARLESASSSPPAATSLINRQRGDDRYVRTHDDLRALAAGAFGFNQIGSFAIAARNPTSAGPGDTTSGSNLNTVHLVQEEDGSRLLVGSQGQTFSGTWRLLNAGWPGGSKNIFLVQRVA